MHKLYTRALTRIVKWGETLFAFVRRILLRMGNKNRQIFFSYMCSSFDEKDLMLVMEGHATWFRVPNVPSSVDRVKTLFFPTSKMEECRIILAEQDNLLTFSESQDRCHLGLRRLIGSRPFFLPDLKDEIVPNYLSRAG
ncbi:hypothetical protein GQ457_08G034420 [Hibiscus cannabinus]